MAAVAWTVLGADHGATETSRAIAVQEPAAVQAADGRRVIRLPAAARETVLKEMRQMLEALNGLLLAMAEGDRQAMVERALSGGTAIAVDTDPAIAERLGEDFVAPGSSTHEGFDALAGAIEGGADRDSVLARLGTLTSKCVACHASYRVEIVESP